MSATTSTPSILLVDDDPAVRLIVGDHLRAEGYTVINAASGEEAFNCLTLHVVDLVVLDISMAGIGGIGFMKKASLHPDYKNIPVLIFTARENMKDFFNNTGAAGFVPKTAVPELLTSTIRDIMKKHQCTANRKNSHDRLHKLLIVEDDESVRHHLVRLFKTHGMDPHPVADPGHIIEAATTHNPHVILLKYLLPMVNGPSIARLLGSTVSTRSIPIILYDDTGIHHHMDTPLFNVAHFIPDPNDNAFIRTVRRVLVPDQL